jgi:tellurite resistance protein
VELEVDTDMSGVYEEDLASGQKNSVKETAVVMNLRRDEVRIGQSEKESVSTVLEKSACEVNVTEQASVEVPSNNPVIMSSYLQAMFDSMLASLKSDQLQMIATLQESFKVENQKLIKRFERDNQKLRQEITEKLSSETDKFYHLLRQVQDDTESELVAVKRNLQVMGTEFDAKLGQQTKDTSRLAAELTCKIVQNKEQVTEQISKLSYNCILQICRRHTNGI